MLRDNRESRVGAKTHHCGDYYMRTVEAALSEVVSAGNYSVTGQCASQGTLGSKEVHHHKLCRAITTPSPIFRVDLRTVDSQTERLRY